MQAPRIAKPKGKPAGVTLPARKNTARGKRTQPRFARPVHTQPRESVSTIRDNSAPAVSISLNGRTSLFVDLVTIPKGKALLDSRAKCIKAAEDLYSIAKLMDGFKDNTRWSSKTTPEDVFHSIYGKMLQAYRNCDSVKLELIDGTYRMTMKQPIYFQESHPSIPVYWLSVLEYASTDLFNLCIWLVRIVKGMGIQTWQEENDNFMYDEVEQALALKLTNRKASGEDDEEIEDLQRCQAEYSEKGEATKFLKRLNSEGSKKIWLKEYDSLLNKRKVIKGHRDTTLMKDLMQWLSLGRQLVMANDNINNYISYPEEFSDLEENYDEMPGTPDQFVLFLWRHNDWWHETHVDYQESVEQNQGAVPYYKKTVLKTKEDLKPSKESFPELMLEFFYTGKAFERKHRKAFASPEALRKSLYKPGLLIDILV